MPKFVVLYRSLAVAPIHLPADIKKFKIITSLAAHLIGGKNKLVKSDYSLNQAVIEQLKRR